MPTTQEIHQHIDDAMNVSGGRSRDMITVDEARRIALDTVLYSHSGRQPYQKGVSATEADLQFVVRRCADKFREYERLHLAKVPPDESKANVNMLMASMCERVLRGDSRPMSTPTVDWIEEEVRAAFNESRHQRTAAFVARGAALKVLVEDTAMTYQNRIADWMLACFGADITNDMMERCYRFFEEAGELMQALGMPASKAHDLVDYVYGRAKGEPVQEVGGVMVTLAALCHAAGLQMMDAGFSELDRINSPAVMDKIRAKHQAKVLRTPHSALPGVVVPEQTAEGQTT